MASSVPERWVAWEPAVRQSGDRRCQGTTESVGGDDARSERHRPNQPDGSRQVSPLNLLHAVSCQPRDQRKKTQPPTSPSGRTPKSPRATFLADKPGMCSSATPAKTKLTWRDHYATRLHGWVSLFGLTKLKCGSGIACVERLTRAFGRAALASLFCLRPSSQRDGSATRFPSAQGPHESDFKIKKTKQRVDTTSPTQPHASAFAFSWSNSAWVIVPASRSCLADAI
jgi:hypothetical protein